jgi:hypothetical protein
MPNSVTKWKEVAIFKYVNKTKLINLLKNKGKEKGMELEAEDLNIRVR